jgi:hypothetical protein
MNEIEEERLQAWATWLWSSLAKEKRIHRYDALKMLTYDRDEDTLPIYNMTAKDYRRLLNAVLSINNGRLPILIIQFEPEAYQLFLERNKLTDSLASRLLWMYLPQCQAWETTNEANHCYH